MTIFLHLENQGDIVILSNSTPMTINFSKPFVMALCVLTFLGTLDSSFALSDAETKSICTADLEDALQKSPKDVTLIRKTEPAKV